MGLELSDLFSSSTFMPHGHCYLWQPGLVWLQVLSNGVIGLSYVGISATLGYLVWKLREGIPFRAMYLAFGAFIVLCGVTHFFDIYVIWRPVYWLDGWARALTAAVSAATAVMLPLLIPHAVTLARAARAVRDRGIELETAVKDLGTMYQRTKELEQLKSQFFANVSHELRTPLALVTGSVEKMISAENLEDGQRRDLDVILRNARTLHKHVNDLLDAAKLEAGKMKPQYAAADLAGLVRVTAANFDGLAANRGIGYSVKAPVGLPAEVDPDMISRVLLNLLGNAFKFTPSGGAVRCELGAGGDGGPGGSNGRRATLVVADSGPGIPEGFREAIFERFRQLDGKATRRAGGTGLGLAIARDLVELHGGRIRADRAPEGGALFSVELPLDAPEGAEVRARALAGDQDPSHIVRETLDDLRARVEASRPREEGTKPLVLVVEDNPDMSRLLCEVLREECHAETAFDGAMGLEKALALRPDLILTDVMMPGMSGEDLVRAIRARADFTGIPILLLTARAEEDLRVRLLKSGAQDFLTKPFSTDELRARVRNLIALKRAQDVLEQAKSSAEAASRELEAFSYSVAHDLRAPLRHIDSFSEVLLGEHAGGLEQEGRDYLDRIRAAAQRMARIIEDLLRLARISRSDLHRDRVDLSRLAQSVATSLHAGESNRVVDVLIEEDLVTVGDARLLRIALENILENSWKFTRNRPRARIEIGHREENDQPVFFVRDNGAGFDMAQAEKLFRPFQRLHSHEEFEGTGIGLATVQRVIQRHSGRVWAEGEVDRGAVVYFTLGSQWLQAHAQPSSSEQES